MTSLLLKWYLHFFRNHSGILLIFLILPSICFSDVVPRSYNANLLNSEIKIDGIADDAGWTLASIANDFTQLDPVEGDPVSQVTEVRVLYDNSAIYLSAIMYDTHPDSILHELGNRDESGQINSDAFRFGIDPYNKRENGYVFEVSASGVQSESFNDDLTFDAVWESAVTINKQGWIVEMKIPYSALRFPAVEEQHWGIQFARSIRRNREYDQWTLTPKNIQNRMRYWGTMNGIKNIDPPLRLSLTPYFSVYGERAPTFEDGVSTGYSNSSSYSGGADIKYGIDESFTLDMTLLPDFSQVQSDNKVKNLSAYETFYEEKRPFFKEGTELFSKGDLLYTRRIGETPTLYYSAPDELATGEILEENPDKAKLYNSTKISGRTDNGLGIGVLNAVTGNTYAKIKKTDGDTRKILTEPLTNYNIFIFDQQLKNNCDVFLVNTNVIREGKYRDANVTTGQGRFENKKHQYRLIGAYSTSHIKQWENNESGIEEKKDIVGERVTFNAEKVSGVSWYGATYDVITKNYDKNDFGYLNTNDYSEISGYYTYNKFNPFWKYFKQGNISLYTSRSGRLSENNQLQSFGINLSLFLLFKSNWSIYSEFGGHPVQGRDYYEPRIETRYYNTPTSNYGSINFTTNYNHRLAFDFGGRYYSITENKNFDIGYYIIPMFRFNDHFNIKFSNYYDIYKNEVGFAYTSSANDSSFFGSRDITTITNTLESRYIFKNDMSISLSARHYWSKGNYEKFFYLNPSGDLSDNHVDDIKAYDFNSNYLTIDIVYNWQFAPGSSFLITYKNLILSDTQEDIPNYFPNLKNTFSEPQTNSISLKVLYYLDYQKLKKKN